jgi:biopolymer transport protein ExbB/TolQ
MSNSSRAPAQPRRTGSTLAAFVVGLPLAGGILGLFHYGPLKHSPFAQYVEYPVQWAVVCLFCVAVGALVVKFLRLRVEFDSLDREILPRWDGKPVNVEKAADLLASIARQDERIQGTYLGRRIRAVLEFICQRRGTAQLDDQLRALADADVTAHENSFGLIKFITWAIPILGFLGTVIGITAAISGVTPEVLEENIGQLTGGLSEAFNATALALALTMVCMFLTFLVERREQALLEEIDGLIDRQLAHRFQDESSSGGPVVQVVQQSSAALTHAVEGLVARQAELWAGMLAEPERRAAETYQRMTEQLIAGLGRAMQATLKMHEERLAVLEQQSVQGTAQLVQQLTGLAVAVRDTGREQQQSLTRVAEGIASQAGVLARIQADEANLVHLQAVLHQNLAALASASSFEEAVHSLTAAVHLLTTRVSPRSTETPAAPTHMPRNRA